MFKKNKILTFLLALLVALPFFASANVGFNWVKTVGNPVYTETTNWQEFSTDIVRDRDGNIYMGGWFQGSVDFDPGVGEAIKQETGSDKHAFLLKLDSSGNFVWVKTWGGNNLPNALAIDSNDNVYLSGIFYTTADFDPSDSVYNITANVSAGWHSNAYLVKLDTDGNFVYAKSWGSPGGNSLSVKIDSLDNIYMGGWLTNTDLDPGAGTVTLGAGSVVIKLDSLGDFLWGKVISGNTVADNYWHNDFDIDTNSNSYLMGSFRGTVDFDPGAGTQNLTSSSSGTIWNSYLVKLDSDGNFSFVKQIEGDQSLINGLSLDSLGNMYLRGTFSGTSDFDPGAGTQNLTSVLPVDPWWRGSGDAFSLKLDSSGNFVSVTQTSGISYNSYEFDSDGNTYVQGLFTGTVDFDPGAGTYNMTSNGQGDHFLLKLDSSGNFVWAKQIGGTSYEYNGGNCGIGSHRIKVLANDTLYMVGNTMSSIVDLDPTLGVYSHIPVNTASGNRDIFVLSLISDTTTPTISSTSSSNITNSSATITWNTDELSSSIVEYGTTTNYGTSTTETDISTGVTSHTVNLSNLQPCTTYHYRTKSNDPSANLAISSDFTFTTPGCGAVSVFILQAQSDAERLPTVVLTSNNTQNNNQTNNTTSKFIFLKNLKYKDNNTDVKELQKFLNTHNFPVSTTGIGSLNNETNYFGIATKNALIKYQIANNIKPAVGYFGVLTRGVVNR